MPIKVVLLGNGARGRLYADYVRAHPRQYELVAVADLLEGVDWRAVVASQKLLTADAAIIALPDKLHCEAGCACLRAGMHVLLEKPIGCSMEECEQLGAAVRESGRVMLPGYVLRFSKHYQKLKEILDSGAIGEVVSIHHLNAVGYEKTENNFCRGNWGREETSGPMILTKSSHDLDLISWWCADRQLESVVSLGGQTAFRPEKAPAGSAAVCNDCTLDCAFRTQDETCVYHSGADVVDHQSTLIQYANGPLVNFELEALSARRGRFTRFFGSRGTLLSDDNESPRIVLRRFGEPEQVFDTRTELYHGGGDEGIMEEFARLVHGSGCEMRGERVFEETMKSHKLAFMAEKSRKGGKIVYADGE